MADKEDEGVMIHGYEEFFLDALVKSVRKTVVDELGGPKAASKEAITFAVTDRLRLIAQKLARGSKKPPPVLQKGGA